MPVTEKHLFILQQFILCFNSSVALYMQTFGRNCRVKNYDFMFELLEPSQEFIIWHLFMRSHSETFYKEDRYWQLVAAAQLIAKASTACINMTWRSACPVTRPCPLWQDRDYPECPELFLHPAQPTFVLSLDRSCYSEGLRLCFCPLWQPWFLPLIRPDTWSITQTRGEINHRCSAAGATSLRRNGRHS